MSPAFRAGLVKVLGVLAVAGAFWQMPYSLAWNRTPSIPTGLYLTKKFDGGLPARQSVVCIAYSAPAWAAGRRYQPEGYRICKPIAGIAGDIVEKIDGAVRVRTPAGETTASVLPLLTDRGGAALNTQALRPGPIAQGEVVLLATYHPSSLDSRYLGAFPISKITHQIWPLWVKD